MRLERVSRTRPVTVRREGPADWEAYCLTCDYVGSRTVLNVSRETWAEAMHVADEHGRERHGRA